MSVMNPGQLRNVPGRQPVQEMPPDQAQLQRQAVMDQLGSNPAQPVASSPGAFARGGQVKQLPGSGAAGKIGDTLGGVGVQIAGQQVGRAAASAAAQASSQAAASGVGGVAAGGLKSALTSGAGGAAAGMGIGIGTGLLANKLRDKEDMPTFGGANAEYLDEKGRRFQGTGGGINSNAVKYAGMVANPALTASTMGLNLAAGAAFGAIKGAITKHAKSAYTDFSVEDGAQAIKDIYKKELGREASDEEVQAHLVNQGWDPTGGDRWVGEKGINGVLDNIRSSPEAKQYATRGAVMDQLGTSDGASAPAQELPIASAGGAGSLEERMGLPPGSIQTSQGGPNLPQLQPDGTYITPAAGPSFLPGEMDPAGAGGVSLPPDAQAGADARQATATDTSGWDTDWYSAPAYVPPGAGPVPSGWDATKWNDPNHQTPKYGVGRILSNFPATVDGLKAAMPDIEKAYPGTTFNGKDKVTLPGVGTIDVLEAAGLGGKAWRWDDGSGGSGGDAGGAHGGASGAGVDVGKHAATGNTEPDGDLLARLQAELNRILAGSPDRGAIMAQLGESNG